MHQRAQRVHPPTRQPAHRADPEPDLGGGVQGPHHGAHPHVLRQRGNHSELKLFKTIIILQIKTIQSPLKVSHL